MAISGATEFSEFYERLKNLKDYHRRYPNEVVEPLELELVPDVEKEEQGACLREYLLLEPSADSSGAAIRIGQHVFRRRRNGKISRFACSF